MAASNVTVRIEGLEALEELVKRLEAAVERVDEIGLSVRFPRRLCDDTEINVVNNGGI